MTSTPEPNAAEPTNADLAAQLRELSTFLSTAFAAVNANFEAQHRAIAGITATASFLEAKQDGLTNSVAQHRGETRAAFEAVGRDMAQLRQDVAGVKSDTAFVERWNQDMHEALVRHIADPNAHRNAA